jgi:hypothetical protein
VRLRTSTWRSDVVQSHRPSGSRIAACPLEEKQDCAGSVHCSRTTPA